MQKTKLDKFIQKYNLGGHVNSVKWKSSDNGLKTSFVTPDKTLLGHVSVDNLTMEDSTIGIYQTDLLRKLLGVLSDDISVSLTKAGDSAVSLQVGDNDNVNVNYVLSDLSVIAEPPALKRIPPMGTEIKIDASFIDKFIRSKSALNDVDSFAVLNEGGNVKLVIGYSSTNTNRIDLSVSTTKCDIEKPIYFNANLFKEVLVANKECTSAVFKISTEGLAKIQFKVNDYDSTYFLVAMDDVN